MKQTHFFLGANSAEGFYGLYDQLLDARLYDLIILKGTPGCGKSTFMRRAAARWRSAEWRPCTSIAPAIPIHSTG